MSELGILPAGEPTPDWHQPQHRCPHCPDYVPASRLDDHVTGTHADLPPCTARIVDEHGLYTCAFRVGHQDGEHGDWHASSREGPAGRTVWADWAVGARPHQP